VNVLGSERRRDALLVVAVALAARLAVIAYAAGRFPPADDGTFYHVVASRIAEGLGYTWLWPDGAVTYAAHYPVGYPTLIGLGYALFGARITVAMLVNAAFGTLAAFAAHSLAATSAPRRAALAAGLFVALEPALVLYTPALMTEGVAGALLVAAAAVAANEWPARPYVRAAVAGGVLGVGVLVRPELLVLTPIVGLIALRREGARRRALGATITLVAGLCVCLPWTLRNCERLERCALVSVNGGWNLYIGSSPLGDGGWAPIERIGVPAECRTVFAEAEKDACFGRAGLRAIGRDPWPWLALVPRKLAATFDYGTAAAHYLSASNPALVGDREKTAVGATELLAQRVLLLLALVALARADGPRRQARFAVLALSGVTVLLPGAWLGWIGLVVAALLLGRKLAGVPTALLAVASVAMTAGVHAVFFGASRYTLVCLPALAALAGSAIGRSFDPSVAASRSFDTEGKVAG
jgi:4-amino-4-deoxy-L-arabinose transferase-like glycosyltransferase